MMSNRLLYVVTVLVWGSTWIAIEFQLDLVAPEVSVFYRYVIATAFRDRPGTVVLRGAQEQMKVAVGAVELPPLVLRAFSRPSRRPRRARQ